MTAARNSAPLYTPDILALAVALADFPLSAAMPLAGEARSRTCGSRVSLACVIDGKGRIDELGVRAAACAIGQASTALFARSARGRDRAEIAAARDALRAWLDGEGGAPDWPEIERIAPARAFPARHGAILLAWDAALAALPKP